MTWRGLAPLGRVAAALAFATLLAAVAGGVGLRWDPFDLQGRRLEAARAAALRTAANAAARALEVEGSVSQTARLDRLHQQTTAVERATARAAALAWSAHDSSISLDPARADRLLRHDRELCGLAADLCAAAPAGPSGGGDDALSSGPPARGADTGRPGTGL